MSSDVNKVDILLYVFISFAWLWAFIKLLWYFSYGKISNRYSHESTTKDDVSECDENVNLLMGKTKSNVEYDNIELAYTHQPEYNGLLSTGIYMKSSLLWVKIHIILALVWMILLVVSLLNLHSSFNLISKYA
eukprot:259656_1